MGLGNLIRNLLGKKTSRESPPETFTDEYPTDADQIQFAGVPREFIDIIDGSYRKYGLGSPGYQGP